jgi:hypothetical protein
MFLELNRLFVHYFCTLTRGKNARLLILKLINGGTQKPVNNDSSVPPCLFQMISLNVKVQVIEKQYP